MCANCQFHRENHPLDEGPIVGKGKARAVESPSLGSYLHRPLSRARLLKLTGGGVAAAIAGGALNLNLARSSDATLPYVVVIVLDGARPEYLNVSGIPHVRSLIRNGTQYTNAFAGILESETPSAHVSIGTGSEPARTGVPSFWWANSQNTRVSLFDPAKIRAGDMERIIRQAGVPTLAGRVHARSRSSKVVALSGGKYYAADAIGGPDADFTMYFQRDGRGQWAPTSIPGHVAPTSVLRAPGLVTKTTQMSLGVQNHLAMKLAVESFTRVHQRVTLINLPEFDWPLGHVNGGIIAPSNVNTLMRAFDRDLGMLQDAYRKAGVLDRTLFVLMADHGMMPLSHTVPESLFSNAVSKAGTTLVSQAYTSAAYLWLKDETRSLQAAQNVAKANNRSIQSVYARVRRGGRFTYVRATSGQLLRSGGMEQANQNLLNSFNGSNAPDVVALFTEGAGCEPGGQAHWKADHGGTSWQAQHIPLVLSGAGVRAGRVSSYPARLIDIAPTILQVMGGSHKGMQGIPLADALEARPTWTTQWQQAASKRLMPVVTALQQESRLELAARS